MKDLDFLFFTGTLRGTCSRALTFENVLRESNRQEYEKYRNMGFFTVTLCSTCARALTF